MSFHLVARDAVSKDAVSNDAVVPGSFTRLVSASLAATSKRFFPLVMLQLVMILFGDRGWAQPHATSSASAGASSLGTAVPASAGVVCVKASSGTIAVRAKCKSNEKRLSVATLSALGVQGAQGPQGPQGPSGAPGLNAFDGIPSGKTVFGVIGGDFEAWDVGQTFFAYASLPSFAPVPLSALTVTVANTSAVSDCSGVSCLSVEEQEQSSACQGSVNAPSAPPGRVCIYPLYRTNSVGVTGYAFAPSSSPGAGRFGFSVGWATESAGDTYLEAVWAYTAP